MGDLIHYVSFPGETLAIVSTWYTGDIANSGALSRINELKTPHTLTPGQQIRIPSYLLKKKTPLPKSALSAVAP